MKNSVRNLVVVGLAGAALILTTARPASALSLTGGVDKKYLITGSAVVTAVPAVFKIKFENLTSGTNLSLCAGPIADFDTAKCPTRLSSSGGPGFQFLTIVSTRQLNGKHIWVINNGPATPAQFELTIE